VIDDPTTISMGFMFIGLPILSLTLMLMLIVNRLFKLREKKLELQAGIAVEKAAQHARGIAEVEQRVRVLEQIVTDAGAETAAQIEALRKPRSLNPATAARKSGE
jgi:DNA-binding protein H-NS